MNNLKRTALIVFLSIGFYLPYNGFAQVTLNEFGNTLLNCIQHNESTNLTLLPDKQDLGAYYITLGADSTVYSTTMFREFKQNPKEAFFSEVQRLRNESEDYGINWKNVSLDSVSIATIPFHYQQENTDRTVNLNTLTIWFSEYNRAYILQSKVVFKNKNQWFIGNNQLLIQEID